MMGFITDGERDFYGRKDRGSIFESNNKNFPGPSYYNPQQDLTAASSTSFCDIVTMSKSNIKSFH